jgi:hypothetical protein
VREEPVGFLVPLFVGEGRSAISSVLVSGTEVSGVPLIFFGDGLFFTEECFDPDSDCGRVLAESLKEESGESSCLDESFAAWEVFKRGLGAMPHVLGAPLSAPAQACCPKRRRGEAAEVFSRDRDAARVYYLCMTCCLWPKEPDF